jgi:hypothetical protein
VPTGVEEFVLAVVGTLGQIAGAGAAASVFSGPLDANGGIEALAGAALASEQLVSPELYEGDPGPGVRVGGTEDGRARVASQAAANGDRPPPPDGYEPPIDEMEFPPGVQVTELYFDDGLIVVVPRDAPPAGEREDAAEPAGSAFAVPPDAPPPADPSDGPQSWVPADIADWWERNVTHMPSALLFGMSGEQASDAAKDAVDRAITAAIDWVNPEEDAGKNAISLSATLAKVPAEILIDIGTGLLDPGSQVRGLLRAGTGTPDGLRDIEQGRVAIGASKIIGEGSGLILTVLSPVKSDRAKRIKAGGGRIEVLASEMSSDPLKTPSDVYTKVSGHNIVKITDASGSVVVTDVTLKWGWGRKKIAGAKKFDPELDKERIQYVDVGSRTASINVPPEAIARVSALIEAAVNSKYGGKPGGIGRFGIGPRALVAENCATYAASLARAGGVVAVGMFGPQAVYWMVRAQIPGWMPVGGAFGATVSAQQNNRSYPNRPR